jgi:3-oxoacyl-[acyl-carrier protein] reductase
MAEAIGIDLRDAAAVREKLNDLAARHEGIHTVVTAHGPFIKMAHISNIDPQEYWNVMETDVLATYNVLHAAIPHLRRLRGSVVVMASAAVRRYAATDFLSVGPKAAIEALARALAVEEGRYGVRANTVGVGMLTDGMYQALVDAGTYTDRYLETAKSNVALRRFGTAAEIAETVAFLTSDKASYITGQMIAVGGGYAV